MYKTQCLNKKKGIGQSIIKNRVIQTFQDHIQTLLMTFLHRVNLFIDAGSGINALYTQTVKHYRTGKQKKKRDFRFFLFIF